MKQIYKWAFVAVWMVLIFMFSGEVANISSHRSGEIVSSLQSSFVPGLAYHDLEVLVRKAAHMLLYFVLGALIFVALKEETKLPMKKEAIITISLAFLYACTDEFHQLFVQGRSSHFSDVLIDTVGASLAVLLCYYYFHSRARKEHRTHVTKNS